MGDKNFHLPTVAVPGPMDYYERVTSHASNDDLLTFADDSDMPALAEEHSEPWHILVVDDDEQVHATTRIVLRHMRLLGRGIHIHEARSGTEARQVIPTIKDLAVILLDVVMESDDAGLRLIPHIREELGLNEVRIILRTGQPGYAPELEIIEQYDINDYKTKQELTHNRLITTLTAAVRGYEQIRTINHSRRGLEKIAQAASTLFETLALHSFSQGIFRHVGDILGSPVEGFIALRNIPGEAMMVVGATSAFRKQLDAPLDDLLAGGAHPLAERALREQRSQHQGTENALYLQSGNKQAVLHFSTNRALGPMDHQLLEVLGGNVAIGYENLSLVQQLEYTAYFDHLTGLPNRQQFLTILERDPRQASGPMISCLLDVDHFADINDGLGQDLGNQLLQTIARRLQENLADCVIARVGADVFGIYGPDTRVNPDIILSLFEESFQVGDYTLPISVTLGFCRALEKGEPGAWQMKYANIALNRAKKNLRDRYEYFKEEMEEHMRWRLEVIGRLRDAFRSAELELWFQPQVSPHNSRVVGIEALLRWRDSVKGFISPGVFIPLAEYSGLIIDIGYWVMEEAARALLTLGEAGYHDLGMAINVSVPQFRSSNFVERTRSIFEKAGISPGRVEFEITESIVMDEPKVVIQSLEQLRRLGFKVAIDDFGTGFSAMSYLQELPLDRLKIDKSFIDKIMTPTGLAIVHNITELCTALGLETIAEGVEDGEQAERIRSLGCTLIQGFHFARPMPIKDLLAWLEKWGNA